MSRLRIVWNFGRGFTTDPGGTAIVRTSWVEVRFSLDFDFLATREHAMPADFRLQTVDHPTGTCNCEIFSPAGTGIDADRRCAFSVDVE